MQQNYADSLLRSGIVEARTGSRASAQRYLERAIYASGNSQHDTMAEAWFWMAEVTDDPAEKRKALENALSHDLNHVRARRALAILDGKIRPEEIIDPDALPPAPQGLVQADAERFMCPKCGGRMTFAPDGQSLVCEYCTRHETLQVRAAEEAPEEDFLAAMSTARGHRKPLSQQVFHCGGCGAEFTLPPTLISANCLYCGSPHVVRVQGSKEVIAPEAVLPHVFDAKKAESLLAAWVQQREAGPLSRWTRPQGIYLPIWTFDLGGAIEYTGEITTQEYEYGQRRVKVVRVQDRFPVMVNDLPVPATRKLARPLGHLLAGYDLKALQPYDPRYLADWPAEVYDVPVGDASLDARSQAYRRIQRSMTSTLGDVHLLSTSSAGMLVESFKLALIPAWITRGPGAEEGLLINGQTGSVDGTEEEQKKKGLFDWLADVLES